MHEYAFDVGAWVAAILAVAVFWRKVVKPLWEWNKKAVHLIEDAQASLPVLIEIANEFKPNGGNSLRDSMDRIEQSVGVQAIKQETMYRRQVEFDRRLGALEGCMDEVKEWMRCHDGDHWECTDGS